MEESHETRVVVDVRQQLYREMLDSIIAQQTDMVVMPFEPDGTEASLWRTVKHVLDEIQPEDQLVVVSSYEEPDADRFQQSCDRLLTEFPGLLIVAINWQSQEVIALRNEVRCDQISSSLRAMISAIRTRSRKPATLQ